MTNYLSELEDRTLAMCEGDWVELDMGQDVLRSWFASEYSDEKFRDALEHLADAGLITRRDGGEATEIRATQAGERFLAETKAAGA